MAEKKFIPVKVTDREWAEKLLDGEVFMRPLYEFGAWNLKKEDKQLNNSFRGDLCEGMSGIFGEVEECPIYDSFDENVKKYIKQIWYIDDTDIKYFKIFSLYCMEYDPSTNFFLKPNPKMCEFGDTAVIIADYNEFIERFGKALFKKYDSVVSMMDRVKFYNFRETRETNPLFEKHEKYSYQNELRMAFCELRENKFAMGINSDTSKEIVEDSLKVYLTELLRKPGTADISKTMCNLKKLSAWIRDRNLNERDGVRKYTYKVSEKKLTELIEVMMTTYEINITEKGV